MDFNSICSIAEKGSVLNLNPCSMNRHQEKKIMDVKDRQKIQTDREEKQPLK